MFLHNLVKVLAGDPDEQDINDVRVSTSAITWSNGADQPSFEPAGDPCAQLARADARRGNGYADSRPVFIKTHNDGGLSTIDTEVAAAVYVVRNPLDVAISLAHHIAVPIDKAIELMGTDVFGSWSRHVESWTRTPHPALLVMRYEDMLSDPENTFARLARHVRLSPTAAQLREAIVRCSFTRLQSQERQNGFVEKPAMSQRFFREGRADQWKELLTPAQIARIVEGHAENMRRFGYLSDGLRATAPEDELAPPIAATKIEARARGRRRG
jgi:Sulfotransferase domain